MADASNLITGAIRAVARVSSTASPSLAARLLAHMFTTPIANRAPGREAKWMEAATRHWIPFDDGRALPVDTFGSGPTVLLVHGWSGRGSQMGAFIAPLVDAGYRVVTYDAPAHGDADGRRSSLPEFAIAVERIAEAMGPVSAIIAHSLGAAATTMAVARGVAVERLVYVAPPAAPARYLARAADFLGFSPDVATRAQTLLEQRYGVPFEDASAPKLVPGLSTPLLVIHDDGDAEVPYAEGARVAGLWHGAQLLTTHGKGHRRIVRDDDVVAAALSFVGATSSSVRRACP